MKNGWKREVILAGTRNLTFVKKEFILENKQKENAVLFIFESWRLWKSQLKKKKVKKSAEVKK